MYKLLSSTVASPMIVTGRGLQATGRGIKMVGQKVEDTGDDVVAKGQKIEAVCETMATIEDAKEKQLRAERAAASHARKLARAEATLAALRGKAVKQPAFDHSTIDVDADVMHAHAPV